MIPDLELLDGAEDVTVWVAKHEAPTDMWSLQEAVAWVMRQPDRERITLFRPPGGGVKAAWVDFAQIERLAFAFGIEPVSSAA
ncbi:MAG: hypothetical protein KF779_10375 [Hyphomonadaceae bacterium]|nr:hypothetical protein [Hyphomonadaceae bacterium]